MAIGLPLSKALTSIVPGLLLANWIVEGQFSARVRLLKQRKGLLLLISIFIIYVLGLLWTSGMEWGLNDVKIQLPLLILPLVIGTSTRLNYQQVKQIVYAFAIAVVVASLCSLWVLAGFSGKQIHDPREMSLFISHIRFALLINIAIFSLGWYFLNRGKKSLAEKIFLGLSIIWLSVFLVVLKSATGWVVFLVVLLAVIFQQIFLIKIFSIRVLLLAILLSFFIGPIVYTAHVVNQFYTIDNVPVNIFQERTRNGNTYSQDFENKELENGHYTYLFVNTDEMRDAWNKRSKINYDSTSAAGFNKFVLIRYLTSKGFRKDAEGVEKLSEPDIRNIENGMTNYRFADSFSFYKRIYQVVWEIDVYLKGGNPSGHSVSQRIEYYKMALQIIREDFWFGKGTGGYYPAYQEKYDQNKFFKEKVYRQRSHNMFLSYWIDFGLVGMCYICFALIAPVFVEHKTRSFLLITFLLIVFISFLNEDTLNNHDAISFFAFFYPLFLYSKHEDTMEDELLNTNLP